MHHRRFIYNLSTTPNLFYATSYHTTHWSTYNIFLLIPIFYGLHTQILTSSSHVRNTSPLRTSLSFIKWKAQPTHRLPSVSSYFMDFRQTSHLDAAKASGSTVTSLQSRRFLSAKNQAQQLISFGKKRFPAPSSIHSQTSCWLLVSHL